ncbi:MAG: ABC transporter permease, partial [Solirubrobacteraceae bacterium]
MRLLLLAIGVEVAVFAAISPNFLTVGNAFEITRVSTELGLLAVALTPVIVSGGIDLSVGSMMGLAAVVFGAATTAWHLPIPAAAAIALLVGAAGGALNGLAVARLGLPPLIVTLGSLSIFRGLAEGLTRGAVNYSGFPPRFLFLGQGFLGGVVPAQLPLFLLVLAGYVLLLHRSVVGRALYAIGCSSAGARHAGLPVERRVALVYILSGLTASLAAIIYVAHLGQAKADAGTGYELDAITAVVLGGTSIFGGRGTLWGTLLGLSALSLLQNGLRLAALPSELTGLLTGALLVTTIALDRVRARGSVSAALQEVEVKNSQVAVI